MADPTGMAQQPPPPVRASGGVIEIKLSDVHQLFHSLDPTPFPGQDLDRDVEEFIVGWATEHPRRTHLKLRIHLDRPPDPTVARHVTGALGPYFAYKSQITAGKFSQLIKRGWLSLLIGSIFLALCLGAADLIRQKTQPFFQVLHLSLIIAGWVAMSRPIEIFLYDWWPLLGERGVYTRLSRADVHLVAPSTPQPTLP